MVAPSKHLTSSNMGHQVLRQAAVPHQVVSSLSPCLGNSIGLWVSWRSSAFQCGKRRFSGTLALLTAGPHGILSHCCPAEPQGAGQPAPLTSTPPSAAMTFPPPLRPDQQRLRLPGSWRSMWLPTTASPLRPRSEGWVRSDQAAAHRPRALRRHGLLCVPSPHRALPAEPPRQLGRIFQPAGFIRHGYLTYLHGWW